MLIDQVCVTGSGGARRITAQSSSQLNGYETELIRWLPTSDEIVDLQNECISCFQLYDNLNVLARTRCLNNRTIGSASITCSRVLFFRNEQLKGYCGSPALFAFIAGSSGQLISDPGEPSESENLSAAEMPDSCMYDPNLWAEDFEPNELKEIRRAVAIHGRVVVAGCGEEMRLLAALGSQMPEEIRLQTSFATNAICADSMRFQLQLVPEIDGQIRATLAQHQIRSFEISVAQRV